MLYFSEEYLRRKNSTSRGGQFDGQWQVVESMADLRDGTLILVIGHELWSHRAGTIDEELDGCIRDERANGSDLFSANVKWRTARGQHLERRARGKQHRHNCRALIDQMLAVVQQQQRRTTLKLM